MHNKTYCITVLTNERTKSTWKMSTWIVQISRSVIKGKKMLSKKIRRIVKRSMIKDLPHPRLKSTTYITEGSHSNSTLEKFYWTARCIEIDQFWWNSDQKKIQSSITLMQKGKKFWRKWSIEYWWYLFVTNMHVCRIKFRRNYSKERQTKDHTICRQK